MARTFYVYILASFSRRLYTGVTNDLRRRLREHRAGSPGSHTHRYRVNRLVYFETHSDIRVAIAREKEIKDWTREKRMQLIEERNAGWLDLGADW
jgi:putative endonuclease